MSETWLGTIPLFGTLIIAFGCWAYMLGGRSGKWKRRFVGSLIVSTSVGVEALLVGNFRYGMLGIYPLLIGCFCLGYGSDVIFTKIVKRFIVVITSLLAGLLMCLLLGGTAWYILPIQLVIGLTTIILGVRNPIQAAPEEFFICLLLTECLLMYPFIKGVI